MKTVREIAALVGLFSASGAHATTWKFASIGSNGSVWYVDSESIRTVTDGYNKSVIKVWVKTDFKDVKVVPEREVKQLMYINCAEDSYKLISAIKYRADGSVLSSFSPSYPTYDPIPPETVMSGVLRTVCQ